MLMAADLIGPPALEHLAPEATVDARSFRPAVRVTGADDGYENNDSQAAAWRLGAIDSVTAVSNLSLLDDADWFTFSTETTGGPAHSLGIRFTHSAGDLDLKLFNTDGVEVGSSTGLANAESISLNGLPAGVYFAKVFGKQSKLGAATNSQYALTITPPALPPTVELFGWWSFATNAAHWDSVITMDSQLHNGGSTLSGSFNVQWYLSKDAAGSSDDILLTRVGGGTNYLHSSIGPGANGSRFNVDLQLPAALPTGFSGETFHIIMKTDALGQVDEINEGNNFGQIGQPYDRDQINITTPGAGWSGVDVWDASMDDTPNTVIRDGVLRVNYNYAAPTPWLSSITLEAIGIGSTPITLGSFGVSQVADGKLVNLNSVPGLQAGDYQLRLKATFATGTVSYSTFDAISLLETWTNSGTYAGENIDYNGWTDTAVVMKAGGGTDTLVLNATREEIVSINGFSSFNANLTANQAIYKGSAYDFLRLTGDREIYFQGFERIRFADGSLQELVIRPNDVEYAGQWNLHVTDVPSAWRFTQGSSNVLLVSLDSGVLPPVGAPSWFGVHDLDGRLITDPTDDVNDVVGAPKDYPYPLGHGHMAINVMAANANNGYGVAGINQVSQVMVADVYNGVTLQDAILDAIDYARATGKKVVFQGGVQGETWWSSGGTAASLAHIVSHNADITMFAIAAGNGGPGGNLSDENWWQSVSGVAQLEATQANVMSVGAVENIQPGFVDGLNNADGVWMASYSNRGSNLTLTAPTDSPALDMRGQTFRFGGTSCANPNMAGIASLVWSANPALMGDQLRQVLIDTAHDLGPSGDDNIFGNGMVNADAAVRRAVALARSVDLASLYWGPGLANSATASTFSMVASTDGQLAAPPNVADGAAATLADLAFARPTNEFKLEAESADALTPTATPLTSHAARFASDAAFRHWASDVAPRQFDLRAAAVEASEADLDIVLSLWDEVDEFDTALAV